MGASGRNAVKNGLKQISDQGDRSPDQINQKVLFTRDKQVDHSCHSKVWHNSTGYTENSKNNRGNKPRPVRSDKCHQTKWFLFLLHRIPPKLAHSNQTTKKKADNPQDHPANHRLCVLASGSDNMMFCPCTSTMCSVPHLGQNSGKRFRIVSGFTLVRVLLPQVGQ